MVLGVLARGWVELGGWLENLQGFSRGVGGVGSVLCGSSLMAESEAVIGRRLVACTERGYGRVQIETVLEGACGDVKWPSTAGG